MTTRKLLVTGIRRGTVMTEVKYNKDGSVRKKPGPKKKKVDNAPKTPEAKANQAATQFKKGVSGNPGGKTFRRQTLEMREKMHQLAMEVGMPMLIQVLYDAREDKKFAEALDVLTMMFKYAYGAPRDMVEIEDNTQASSTYAPQIVVTRESALNVLDSDQHYT